jgi:transposase-like protein
MRRKFWSAAQKQQIVEEANAAGANAAEVAQRHNVRLALLTAWRRRARVAAASTKPTKFAAVRVATAQTDGVIEIDLAGGCVRVRGIVDAQMLREVLAATR